VTPSWLEPLPDAAMMRQGDRWAIEERGIPGLDLMERAGEGLARVVAGAAARGPVAVVCGKGNNAGDGFVAARLLRDAGRDVRVLLVLGDALRGDARANLERLDGAHERYGAGALDGAAVIVDAIFGTGFSGEPREPVLGAIEAVNAAGVPVVAADVPSGVDASSGEVAGAAVRARVTATFAAAKPGLWIEPGRSHAGEVDVIDIGIPAGAPVEPGVWLIHPGVLGEIPRRERNATKFDSGHVLVCGGSPGLTGAPCLAAEAAMRAGAGYVTACVPPELSAIFETRLLEVMTAALDADQVVERAQRGGAMVVGPGMGRLPDAQELARELARRAPVPLVLDADGLNAHAGRLEDLAGRVAATILTPHEGELARLLGIESADVRARRLHHAREAARRSRAIVVLKGDDTLVAAPSGRVAVSPGATPALATAGTGDVLSGVLAACLAKGMSPPTAAMAGVLLHARAGRIAAERLGIEAVIASDVIAALPAARLA
jgi:ADP-dependent NAD(P)H-hydrate dehydratase / NAD(P)H-hydrate epimerase